MSFDGPERSDAIERQRPFGATKLGGLEIASCAPATAAASICNIARDNSRSSGASVHLVNAYTIALADRDIGYRKILSNSWANFPDGKPLEWISRLQKSTLQQIRGPWLFGQVMDVGREHQIRHFLLGSTESTLALLRSELESRYPGVRIVGELSPPFRPLSAAEHLQQDDVIRASGADIVWVGLGTPKQDYEAHRLAMNAPVVAVAVGAAFDFVAGTKREAPSWMSKLGLEWLYRFASEPRRLWKRYLFGNIQFLYAALRKR